MTLIFFVVLCLNLRGVLQLALDWRRMLTTRRFVDDAYKRLDALPSEGDLEAASGAPLFLHLVPAFHEPNVGETVRALLASRYPRGKLHVAVVTKAEEDWEPHPGMEASTAELVRRLRTELPLRQQEMLSLLVMPGPGRKAHQLNWALRPENLAVMLGESVAPSGVFIGVSDADSLPDPNAFRWIAAEELAGRGADAYQGVTLPLANFDRLPPRERVCAVQQASTVIRSTIPRLINEPRRIRLFERLASRAPRLAARIRPAFELFFRRSEICLGHNQFVRLSILRKLGGFPTEGATEDSTLGYALGAEGVPIKPLPMLELIDLPETSEKVVRQGARWYKGVLDDVPFLWRTWRSRPTAYNLAQFVRHLVNKAVEWPVAVLVYSAAGCLGCRLAFRFLNHPALFALSYGLPILSLGFGTWLGGTLAPNLLESLRPYFPRPVGLSRPTLSARLWCTFSLQSYWVLGTRGTWRVLWALFTAGRFEEVKTDRVMEPAA